MNNKPPEIQTGTIKYINQSSQNGVIAYPEESGKPDVYFDYKDVEIGAPAEGQLVQFIIQPGLLRPIAKKINVISAVARGAGKRGTQQGRP